MDLTVQIQKSGEEVVGVEKMLKNNYESNVFKLKETYEETDGKGNNNLLDNSLKTDTNTDLDNGPGSLLQDEMSKNEKPNLTEESSLLSCTTFKRAIDLTVHNRNLEGNKRTIFDDAEYFAKNYSYKLLPITFDSVDEQIIHSEHSYCHSTLNSESEGEEDCSRTMDYSQIKEKNYKKRKTKFKQVDSEDKSDEADVAEERVVEANLQNPTEEDDSFNAEPKNLNSSQPEQEFVGPAQPLDLSTPLVQEKKTEHCLREHQICILNKNVDGNGIPEGRPELEKENLKSKVRCIEVTITRPDEKENYQPCDLFLNDIANLVPRLIEKDCSEIDILDRTCDNYVDDVRKHRLYYIISKSTWGLFQSANERVILTNDKNLGQPTLRVEGNERPTYLVFDQFSLAKCLADYCKEIGGCFEYTCVEESEDLPISNEGKEDGSGGENEINKTEIQVEEERVKLSTKNDVQIKFDNAKCGEVGNKSVNVEGNWTGRSCPNYPNDNQKEDGRVNNIPLGESEKVFVETIKVNLNNGKRVQSKLGVEVDSSEQKEKPNEVASFELTTCSAESKGDVDESVLSESEVKSTQKGEFNSAEDAEANHEKGENEDNHCLNKTEEKLPVSNLKENNTKNREVDVITTKRVARRKRKQDCKETKKDAKIKKPNVVSWVTTRSKATTADSKSKTAESSKGETSQKKDEPRGRARRDLKRKGSVLDKKSEVKKEIPKRRKRATTLESPTREPGSEKRKGSGKVGKVEGKNEKIKKGGEVSKQEQQGGAKRNAKKKAEKGEEGVVKTRKMTEATNSQGLRSRTVTSRRNVNFETILAQRRDRKKTFMETRQKRKKKVIGFPRGNR